MKKVRYQEGLTYAGCESGIPMRGGLTMAESSIDKKK
jgi:hypothetical protein